MDFLRRLEEYRSLEKQIAWEGTFQDYLELIKTKPYISQLAHSRIYNMIRAAGVEEKKGETPIFPVSFSPG